MSSNFRGLNGPLIIAKGGDTPQFGRFPFEIRMHKSALNIPRGLVLEEEMDMESEKEEDTNLALSDVAGTNNDTEVSVSPWVNTQIPRHTVYPSCSTNRSSESTYHTNGLGTSNAHIESISVTMASYNAHFEEKRKPSPWRRFKQALSFRRRISWGSSISSSENLAR
ncbi:hypothetical protein NEOLI_001530 [Neolecta irregularis DAH-3]|uniref:Uncharacterized protein n=1 Tax=Neolecta irregularis (strain DAH-3) TaxID=1198029 RepID=A0A1U7LUP0_NEOID|nr:hypothetical protein NEOLI_001530 [Neolecta irregularis DAH-3]|eukprot:OLL26395.1 hypothetical protein NEOLI_001530 [Neolecta irregularis DAH-3]